ncbi:MAG: hypothetical protein KatS3mg077_1082 [Candidatus Binatia bacterium]|nr:MAG: hypothetical protein KatS3mg077_1082 [Candidatus Binatia bacterium]
MRRIRLCAAILACALAHCTEQRTEGRRAAEDPVALLGAVSVATAYAHVRFDRIARIDRTGYRAECIVRTPVSGPLRAGDKITIAWEELATHRAPRFRSGEDVLLALTPVPSTSLWLHRFPPQLRDGKTFVVAAQGDAFVREPDSSRLAWLQAYVGLDPARRSGPEGAAALAQLAARGEERLAHAALKILSQRPAGQLGAQPEVIAALSQILRDGPTSLQLLVVEIARTGPIPGLRSAIVERAQHDVGEVGKLAWATLVAWQDPLVRPQVQAWAEAQDTYWRRLAGQAAIAFDMREVLEKLRSDPEASVREVLARELPATPRSLPLLTTLLSDPDEGVRRAAALTVARVGPAALPELEALISRPGDPAAPAAVLALAEMGDMGRALLEKTAERNPDERLRRLAALALGRAQSEH